MQRQGLDISVTAFSFSLAPRQSGASSPLPAAVVDRGIKSHDRGPAKTAEQAATLKRLTEAAYELEAFQPNLTRADLRISILTAKLKLLDGPPHTL